MCVSALPVGLLLLCAIGVRGWLCMCENEFLSGPIQVNRVPEREKKEHLWAERALFWHSECWENTKQPLNEDRAAKLHARLRRWEKKLNFVRSSTPASSRKFITCDCLFSIDGCASLRRRKMFGEKLRPVMVSAVLNGRFLYAQTEFDSNHDSQRKCWEN